MNPDILERPEVSHVLFHPRRDDFVIVRPGGHIVQADIETGVALGGRLYPAEPESPAILYFHGNGEIAADYDDISDLYVQIGITLLVMDFRGYGTSSGIPTSSSLVGDAVPLFNAVGHIFKQHGLAPSKLFVMGRSLGSVPAIEIASHAESPPAGLIVESGFSDTFGLLRRMGVSIEGADEERDGFGSSFKMEHVTIPTLILHGEHDVLIPSTDGQEFFIRCAAASKQIEIIPQAGHNDIMLIGMRQYFQAIAAFVHMP